MSTLLDINFDKPLHFYGCKTTLSDDPFLVDMAKKMNMPQLRAVSQIITRVFELPAPDSRSLLKFVSACQWLNNFEENLQCLSETDDGEELLTGWMDTKTFIEFLDAAASFGGNVMHTALKLRDMVDGWQNLGVEEVNFDGFRC